MHIEAAKHWVKAQEKATGTANDAGTVACTKRAPQEVPNPGQRHYRKVPTVTITLSDKVQRRWL